jgi:HAD superfamily hydrolase (TIGR01549 family)
MKTIIFDFDGTIADTFPFAQEIVAKFAPKYGFEPLSPEEIQSLRCLSASEIIKKFGINRINLLRMVIDARSEMKNHIKDAKAFDGMAETINKLASKYSLMIISSNSRENINLFLKNNEIKIKKVATEKSLFGKGRVIRKVIEKAGLNKEDVVYVGDEVRDIQAANKAGVRVISVSWGFNRKELLEKHNSLTVDKPGDLLTILNEIRF